MANIHAQSNIRDLHKITAHCHPQVCVDNQPLYPVNILRPAFTHGPPGPGPKAANFQGRHIRKIEIELGYAEKKGCRRERNLREIYTVCLVVPKQEDDHFPSGIAGIV